MCELDANTSGHNAETLKLQEVLAQMRDSRSYYGTKLVCLLTVALARVRAHALHAAGVWSDGADIELLTETLFSGTLMVSVLLSAAFALCFWCSPASTCRILHIVFVTCATCQLWLHSDCLQLSESQRVSNVVRLLVASLMGRPGLVITLGIVFTGAVAARHLNS